MINPVSSTHASQANQVTQPSARPAQPQTPASGPPAQDTVTLKSTGGSDHDGDST